MYCPKCKTEVEDDQLFCHVCGAEVKDSIKNEPEEKPEQDETESKETEISAEPEDVSAEENEPKEETETESEEPSEEPEEKSEEANEDNTAQSPDEKENEDNAPESSDENKNSAEANQKHPAAAEKPVPKTGARKQVRKSAKESKKNSKYTAAMKAIVCVCAVIMVVLAVVSKTTDIFKNDGSDKTMVLSGMSESQKTSFEDFVSRFSALFENGYDSSKAVFDDIISEMNPSIENGLYVSFFGKSKPADESDPAGRFKSDGEEIPYYTASAKEVSKIAKSLSLEALDDTNTMNCYFLGGKYYFSSSQKRKKVNSYSVKVTDAKKTSDDSFYITCDLFKNGSEEPIRQIYFIANESADSESWVLSKISNEALYSPLGSKLSEEKEGTALYIMKSRSIEAKTSDGKLFAKYIVQYPSFETDMITAETLNSQYTELINSFKKEAGNADKLYKKYIKNGGDEADLPLYTHVVASVKYNADSVVSVVERKTVYDPLAKSDTEASNEFAVTSYEAHNFDIQTGDFLKKDDLIGKDYQKAEQILFEKWIGYEEPEDATSPSHPTDINSVGHAIYTSAWFVTDGTVNFLYQHDDSALDIVSIPVEVVSGQ